MKLIQILLVSVLISVVSLRYISESSQDDDSDEEDFNEKLGPCIHPLNENLEDDESKSDENSSDIINDSSDIEDDLGTGWTDTRFRWDKIDDDVILPFEIDEKTGYDEADIKNIKAAMKMIEKDTCVKFKERKDEEFFLFITMQSEGCWTYVGKAGATDSNKKKQTVNFAKNTCKVGRMAHEFIHTLGFVHMHQHPKRNDFIEIHWENVDKKYLRDFARIPDKLGTSFGTPYDYDSIMHYGIKHGALDPKKPTMTVLNDPDKWTTRMGHSKYLTDGDVERINLMYDCGSKKRKANEQISKDKNDDDSDESESKEKSEENSDEDDESDE